MSELIIKRANGEVIILTEKELFGCIVATDFKILGMSLVTISALKDEYLVRSGPMEMTPRTVRETFREKP